jgi:adenylyltransferase/sulfurtransferase
MLPEVGLEGQERLKNAKVLIIGAGGLGSPLGLYLAAAGIGRLGIVDFDVVDASNLQRQILHGTADVGRSKTESARARLRDLNPHVEIETHEGAMSADNAMEIIRPYDIVVDGTDNFPTRYLVNDACVLLGKPNVYGSIFRFEGQASVFSADRGPCYRCLYPDPPPPGLVPNCAEGGVLGILPGVIGAIQATEAIKLVLDRGTSLIGRLLLFDALAMEFREMALHKDPACPLCGTNPTIRGLIDYEAFCGVAGVTNGDPRGTGAGSPAGEGEETELETTPRDLKARLDRGDRLVLVDVRTAHEWSIGRIEGAVHIPLPELSARWKELSRDAEIVTICHVGIRSAHAAEFLRSMGFRRVLNLAGGLRRWGREVDPNLGYF